MNLFNHNQSKNAFKNRVLLVVFLLTSVFIFIFVALIYMSQKSNFENTKKEFQSTLGHSIEQTIDLTINTYSLLAKTILETTKARVDERGKERRATFTYRIKMEKLEYPKSRI